MSFDDLIKRIESVVTINGVYNEKHRQDNNLDTYGFVMKLSEAEKLFTLIRQNSLYVDSLNAKYFPDRKYYPRTEGPSYDLHEIFIGRKRLFSMSLYDREEWPHHNTFPLIFIQLIIKVENIPKFCDIWDKSGIDKFTAPNTSDSWMSWFSQKYEDWYSACRTSFHTEEFDQSIPRE